MSKLILVPTPIGNLDDMSFRAIECLKNSAFVLAEDTRVSQKLFRHFEISVALRSFHQHNEHKVLDRTVEQILNEDQVALISDAGTPAISDPGFLLVRACLKAGIEIECLPGATAFVPALVCSGLPCDKFIFEGFLPHKKGRQTRIESFIEEERSIVLYESPHRIAKTLTQFKEILGSEREVCVSREISKMFEEHVRGTIEEVLPKFENKKTKGEIVIVLAGKSYRSSKESAE